MNAKYAWLELDRVEPPTRPAPNRVSDFREIYGFYDEATAREQASRCVQCPNPPCQEACPLGVPIPELIGLTADGQFRDAAARLLATHTLPEIFAHICIGGHLCETSCVLASRSESLPISSLARFLLEYANQHGLAEPPPMAPNGQRVAVIGAGICGLVSADLLSCQGYSVTLFDSLLKAGGRVVNGLPGFRVDNALISHRVELLKQRGVLCRLGVRFGRDVTLTDVRGRFDAVLVSPGRTDPVPLDIPGADLTGVGQAYRFVQESTVEPSVGSSRPSVLNKRVVVLGGGDTAMDALRVAIRCGARDALCVYRRDRPNMAANPEERRHAEEEGAHFLFLTQATAVLGNAAGQVTHVRCQRMSSGAPSSTSRTVPIPVDEAPFDLPADVLLVAYGFKPPTLPPEGGFSELATSPTGHLVVGLGQMTNVTGVFAAGAGVRGAVPLAEIVRDARRAVSGIDAYLSLQRSI